MRAFSGQIRLYFIFMTFATSLHCEGHIVHFAEGRGNKDSLGGGGGGD